MQKNHVKEQAMAWISRCLLAVYFFSKQRNAKFIIGIFLSLLSITTYADALQRQLFQQAYQAFLQKNDIEFQLLAKTLKNYPISYYLQFIELERKLKTATSSEVKDFLNKYSDTQVAYRLRRQWLYLLAKRKDWQTYLDFYTPQNHKYLRCYQLQARLETGRQQTDLLQDILNMWLVGHSQPKVCDNAFDYLYKSNTLDDDTVWQRIRLAMQKNKSGLAKYLTKFLQSKSYKKLVSRWRTMHSSPAKALANTDYSDTAMEREILAHGLKQLTKKQVWQAYEFWQTYQKKYTFSQQQRDEINQLIAFEAADQYNPNYATWLIQLDKKLIDEKLLREGLRTALKKEDWSSILSFVQKLPGTKTLQWQYWQARALEKLNKTQQAKAIYQSLAKNRDYYGFLAADKLGVAYNIRQTHRSLNTSKKVQNQLVKDKRIIRAQEFFYVDLKREARSEWQAAIDEFNQEQLKAAAMLAYQWKWHDRAIFAAGKANAFDDMNIRFPVVYRKQIEAGAKAQELELAWVYGLIRQESAFWVDAGSHAGAMGLMQLMPATARNVARQIDLKLPSKQAILDVDNNIQMGTYYLRKMLDTFEGNHVLAEVAYNAGPGRAKRWSKENACLPIDIWIELIPFNETRNYVRSVSMYTSIFEARLGYPKVGPLKIKDIHMKDSEECQ